MKVMVMAFGLLAVAAQAAAGALPYNLVVEKEGAEDPVFEQITAALTGEAKLDGALVSAALKGFDRYIDKRLEKERKKVTLYPQAIFEVAKAGGTKGWPGAEIGDLLIHMQREIDGENRPATRMKKVAVAEIAKGKKLAGVIAALEAGEDDDDGDGDEKR